MTQFVAFDPVVEVNGTTVMSVIAGMGDAVKPVLAAHGFVDVRPDGWYSQQAWLDVFHEIAQMPTRLCDMVNIGMEIPRSAIFPPDIHSVDAALHAIDVAYHMNHRGGEIGDYAATTIGDHQVDLVCHNPYPCEFDYGIIYGMAIRFCPPGARVSVRHDDAAGCRQKGAESCTYHVSWE